MLARIHINNLAVIDEVELEFESGMTALTGETGAGKSILVDALALALGERADSKAVRTGTDRCTVTATFDIKEAGHVTRWLQAHDLDADDECIIRRVVSADGRSRGYLNGNNVPMQTLREIGEQLLDICGQQAHQSLRHPRMQQELLDGFGGHESLLKKMADAFADWQNLHAELTSLQEAQDDRSARLDLLTYQVAELNALNLGVDELTSIDQEHARIANAGRIASALENALAEMYETESGSAYAVLSSAKQTFTELGEIDTRLSPLAEMLSEAEILIAETASVIREQQDALEHDPARLQQLEQRLSDIHELARKHRIEASALPALTVKLNEELSQIESSDERLEALQTETIAARKKLDQIAAKLSKARSKAASAIGEQVTFHMQELGMVGGQFIVEVSPSDKTHPGATGQDQIEFTVAINPGQAAGPLAKVASGGELSRVSLALQVVATANTSVTTLIFDEVDSGVGGGVAEIVGNRLSELGNQRQVLCVTHLPQVASQASHHMRVSKITDGQSTRTSVKSLTQPERVEEIARMLGGVKLTDKTRAHAREMLG